MTDTPLRSLLESGPHRRFNALTGDWVLVSPQRSERPWQGRREAIGSQLLPMYDPDCYLCPGNLRAGGRNAVYASTYVFENDFPALLPDVGGCREVQSSPLLRAQRESGICRVICYSPRHDLSLAQLPVPQLLSVVDTWAEQVNELDMDWTWVQVFENKGELMGCSNPHPHGQIWAGNFIPNEVARELSRQRDWFAGSGRSLLLDYLQLESSEAERVVLENADWLALVPWWAVWPFETLLLPRRAVARLPDLTPGERRSLADILHRLLAGYDRLFGVPFPYSFGWHGAPAAWREMSATDDRAWQLHAHFYPPLLRSAGIKKFMVGYEMLAEAQRDGTPEASARRLREAAKDP